MSLLRSRLCTKCFGRNLAHKPNSMHTKHKKKQLHHHLITFFIQKPIVSNNSHYCKYQLIISRYSYNFFNTQKRVNQIYIMFLLGLRYKNSKHIICLSLSFVFLYFGGKKTRDDEKSCWWWWFYSRVFYNHTWIQKKT